MHETIEKLLTFASEKFDLPRDEMQKSDDLFEKLKIDSVQALSLLSDIESIFQVEIPDYELEDVKTFEELAECIFRRKA